MDGDCEVSSFWEFLLQRITSTKKMNISMSKMKLYKVRVREKKCGYRETKRGEK